MFYKLLCAAFLAIMGMSFLCLIALCNILWAAILLSVAFAMWIIFENRMAK